MFSSVFIILDSGLWRIWGKLLRNIDIDIDIDKFNTWLYYLDII